MDIHLRDLIYWPDCEALQKTMPICFQQSFGKKVAIVIDCFKVFIERPSSLEARAASWSNYKHHNTVKVLLEITPQGVISFVSNTWGGQVSDKHLTENCRHNENMYSSIKRHNQKYTKLRCVQYRSKVLGNDVWMT